MVALSPRFTFLATLCTLTAISMAPLSEAAILRMRPPSTDVRSTSVHTHPGATTSHDHYALSTDPRTDPKDDDKIYAPILPMPKSKASSSGSSGSSGSKNNRKSGDDSHGEDVSEGDESKHASHGDQGSVSKKEMTNDKGRRWNLSQPMNQLKDFLGEKMFSDNHYVRAPDHHYHHHHHHHHHDRSRRSRMNWGSENGRIVSRDNVHIAYSRAPYYHHGPREKIIASGNRDHVHVGRSPHHHHHDHHDHHHDVHEKVIVSGNNDHVHVSRSPHHHHHHHDEKVIVSGDGDHVHVHRSVSIAGEQGQSYIVPHVVKRASAQESFSLPSLGKRNGDIDGARGRIDIVSPDVESAEGKRIASLVVAPSNSTLDNTAQSLEFVLNASEANSTQMYLLPTSDSFSEYDATFAANEIGVTIRVAVFNMASASTSPYCATFDPNPPSPAPLRAGECTKNPVSEHQSQLFAFNKDNGVVRPMWFNDGTEPEKGDCPVDAPPTPQNASLAGATEVDTKNVTSTPGTMPATTGNATTLPADTPQAAPSNSSGTGVSGAQKVALVFVAADPEVMDSPAVVATSTTTSVLATSTGAGTNDKVVSTANGSSTTVMAGSSSGSLAGTSPAVLATASGSSSVSASTLPSTASDAAVSTPVTNGTPGSLPSSAATVPGSNPTPTTVLGVQVVPTTEGSAHSTPSATPLMTPVSTQPYEWMFKTDSRS